MSKKLFVAAAVAALVATIGLPGAPAGAAGQTTKGYLVVLTGEQTAEGFSAAVPVSETLTAIESLDGAVVNDLSSKIGVLIVHSDNALFADTLRASPAVSEVGEDFGVKAIPAAGEFSSQYGAEPSEDTLEPLQWDMQRIRTEQAHATEAGVRAVDVGILDSGISAAHPDFIDEDGTSNVDCARGRNSIVFFPAGPGIGTPDPCTDNQFHGTHVAGTVAAQANGVGIVGVAPNVTLVPVKVCDTTGYCYASAVVDGITYSGDQQFDVINMSFFVDDDEFQQSTEYKCMDDPVQRAFRRAVERAIQYARNRGVAPVAALGNSDDDLAHPPEPNENNCDIVPAESSGVVGTSSLGNRSEKAGYSNYGTGANDVSAPGGNGTTGDCTRTVLSTLPGGTYGCFQGTSMASPHAAGVAALIVSRFGTLGSDGDVKMSPTKVENYLQSTTVDIGLRGYDECFGHGRIDALRAVLHDTSTVHDATAPFCPEYND